MEKHAFLNQQQKREIFDLKGKNQINFGHPQQLQFASSNVEPKNNIPVNNMNRLAGQLDPSYKEHQQIKQYNALIPNFKRDPLTDLLFNLLIKQSDNKEIQSSDQIVSAQELIVRGQKIKKTMEQTWGDVFTEVCQNNKITPTQEMIDIFVESSTQKLLEDGNAKQAFDLAYNLLSDDKTFVENKDTQSILRKQFFTGLLKQPQNENKEKKKSTNNYRNWLLKNCKRGIEDMTLNTKHNNVLNELAENKKIQNIIDIINMDHHVKYKVLNTIIENAIVFTKNELFLSIKNGDKDDLNVAGIFTNQQMKQYFVNYLVDKYPEKNKNFMDYQDDCFLNKNGEFFTCTPKKIKDNYDSRDLFTNCYTEWIEKKIKDMSHENKMDFLKNQLTQNLDKQSLQKRAILVVLRKINDSLRCSINSAVKDFLPDISSTVFMSDSIKKIINNQVDVNNIIDSQNELYKIFHDTTENITCKLNRIKNIANNNFSVNEAIAILENQMQVKNVIDNQIDAQRIIYAKSELRNFLEKQLADQNKKLADQNKQLADLNKQLVDQRKQLADQEKQLDDKINFQNQQMDILQLTKEIMQSILSQEAFHTDLYKKNGLTTKQYEALKTMKIGKSVKKCTICCQNFCKDELLKQFPCGDLAHIECAIDWFHSHTECPSLGCQNSVLTGQSLKNKPISDAVQDVYKTIQQITMGMYTKM